MGALTIGVAYLVAQMGLGLFLISGFNDNGDPGGWETMWGYAGNFFLAAGVIGVLGLVGVIWAVIPRRRRSEAEDAEQAPKLFQPPEPDGDDTEDSGSPR